MENLERRSLVLKLVIDHWILVDSEDVLGRADRVFWGRNESQRLACLKSVAAVRKGVS